MFIYNPKVTNKRLLIVEVITPFFFPFQNSFDANENPIEHFNKINFKFDTQALKHIVPCSYQPKETRMCWSNRRLMQI